MDLKCILYKYKLLNSPNNGNRIIGMTDSHKRNFYKVIIYWTQMFKNENLIPVCFHWTTPYHLLFNVINITFEQ